MEAGQRGVGPVTLSDGLPLLLGSVGKFDNQNRWKTFDHLGDVFEEGIHLGDLGETRSAFSEAVKTEAPYRRLLKKP